MQEESTKSGNREAQETTVEAVESKAKHFGAI